MINTLTTKRLKRSVEGQRRLKDNLREKEWRLSAIECAKLEELVVRYTKECKAVTYSCSLSVAVQRIDVKSRIVHSKD